MAERTEPESSGPDSVGPASGRPERIGAAAALARLEGWRAVDGRDAMAKSFRFADFNAAWGWMTRVALKADAMNHHPEWSNVYNRVEVLLATHDADGVTERDVALARFMDEAASPGPEAA